MRARGNVRARRGPPPPTDASPVPAGSAPACAASPQIHGNLKPLWSQTLGAGGSVYVATDAANDVIVAGTALGSVTVGGQSFPVEDEATGGFAPFLLKLDPSGQPLWHREFGGEADVLAAALDPMGNLVVSGEVGQFSTSPADLGDGPLARSFFLAKFDPQGKTLWVDSASCSGFGALSLAVDPSGNVAVVGEASDTTCFGAPLADAGVSPESQGGGFVAVFDGSGNTLYAKVLSQSPPGIAGQFDSSGNLLLAGSFSGTLDLGTPLAAPAGGTSAFVAKLDPSGNVLWQLRDGTNASATAIAVGGSGATVAGTFGGTVGVAHTTSAVGPADVFLLGVDGSGAPALEKTFPSAGLSVGALAADPTGGIVTAGPLWAYDDLGDGLLAPPGIAVAKFDASGNIVYSARFAVVPYTGLATGPPSLAVDTGGNVVLGSTGAGDFGTGVLASADPNPLGTTLVVARYAPEAPVLSAPRAECPVPQTDAGLPEGGTILASVVDVQSDMALGPDAVYFTTGSEVMSVPLAGGATQPLAIAQRGAGPLVLDSNTLYWTNSGSFDGSSASGSVVAYDLDGGTVTILAPGQDAPGALTVDGTHVYYVAGGSPSGDGGISSVNLLSIPRAGGAATVVARGLAAKGPVAVAGGVLAFATSGTSTPTPTSAIYIVPVTGGPTTMLATSDHRVSSIAIDGNNVYWLDQSTTRVDSVGADGRVRAVPLAGGAATILADNQAAPNKLALLGSTVFWSTGGSWANVTPAGNAGLWTLPTAGGTPVGLLTGRAAVATFAVDAAHVAWFDLLDSESALLGVFAMGR